MSQTQVNGWEDVEITQDLDMGNNYRVTNVPDGASADGDMANWKEVKEYADSVGEAMRIKAPVRALADSNQSLSGTATIDTVNLVEDDRVLLTNQTTGTENGIWVVKTSTWQRPADFASGSSAHGATCWVDEGDVYEDQRWTCTNDLGSDEVDADALTFVKTSGLGQVIAGTGLTKSGNEIRIGDGTTGDVGGINRAADDISVATDGSTLEVASNQVQVKDSGITETQLNASVAGDGLTGGAGSALAVGAGNGIAVNADDIDVTQTREDFTTSTGTTIIVSQSMDTSLPILVSYRGLVRRPGASHDYTITTTTNPNDTVTFTFTLAANRNASVIYWPA